MQKTFSKLITCFAVVFCIVISAGIAVNSRAAVPDFEKWNQCRLFCVLEAGKESNSAYSNIFMRVEEDEKAHQIHFLVMATMKSMGDTDNCGVRLKINDMGTVEIFCDGSTEYDDRLFYAELDNVYYDTRAKDIWIEFTVGIKPGIPDEIMLEFSMYDTDGVISNTFDVDISEESPDEIDEGGASPTVKTTKTTKVKTTKVKTTKVRTTKVKTTKVKTTKVKTTKVKTSRTSKTKYTKYDAENDPDEDDIYSSDRNMISFEDVEKPNDKNKLVIIGAAAIIVCAVAGCAISVKNSRKNKGRGDK